MLFFNENFVVFMDKSYKEILNWKSVFLKKEL